MVKSDNLFPITVMTHLKTKVATKDLTKFDIINLVKFIDKMMRLPAPLQTEFQNKLERYEKELNMPFLSTIEELAQEKGKEIGKEIGSKKTRQQDIIKILSNRFDHVPELISLSIKQIDDMSILENLLLRSISVDSLAEFKMLIDAILPEN